ncbi:MAG TPA: hypothetical protein VF268_06050 [Gammaproteobacteria bacterium]|jgi:hypothetical protein
MIRLIGIFVIVLSAGCAMLPDTVEPFTVSREAREFCDLLTVDTDAGKNLLLKPYGKPDRVDVKTMPNKHEPEAEDEIHTAHYEDGRVVIYSVPHIGRNYPLEIVLTGKFWPQRLSRHIGKSSREIVEYFGPPNQTRSNDLVYFCSPEADQYLQFHMTLSGLARLEIKGWVD